MSNARLRTLRRAVELLGSVAEALGVRLEEVERWLAGKAALPDAPYFAALDIVARGPFGSGSGGAAGS